MKPHDCNCDVQPALSPAPLLGCVSKSQRLELIKLAYLRTETDDQKYKRLKKQIHNNVMLSREDFLFVKVRDQRSNIRPKTPPKTGLDLTYNGYNTAPR